MGGLVGIAAWDRLVDAAGRVTISADMPEKADGLLVRYFVPGRPANLGNSRMHWAERARLVAQERMATRVIGQSERIKAELPKADGPRKVTVTFELAGSLFDVDGKVSASKPYLDGLADAGLITGDREGEIELVVSQRKVRYRDAQGVCIEVWRAD